MANVNVLNWKKEKVGQVDLDSSVFEVPFNKELLHSIVRWQLASRRQGTAMTKTKGLVSGGGKKPFKQPGTGGARQGSSRSILMPGGGTAFGPQPRDYSYNVPKKMRRAGLTVALSYLLREGRLFIVDSMESTGKTNSFAKTLAGFGVKKAVLIDSESEQMTSRAAKNLPTYKYYGVDGLNVFDLLKYDSALITKKSVEKIVDRCKVEKS
jgi:large subunit ribosomal protein L4